MTMYVNRLVGSWLKARTSFAGRKCLQRDQLTSTRPASSAFLATLARTEIEDSKSPDLTLVSMMGQIIRTVCGYT
jgi:hypothetical protein